MPDAVHVFDGSSRCAGNAISFSGVLRRIAVVKPARDALWDAMMQP